MLHREAFKSFFSGTSPDVRSGSSFGVPKGNLLVVLSRQPPRVLGGNPSIALPGDLPVVSSRTPLDVHSGNPFGVPNGFSLEKLL